jgi:hypothetical protein
MINVQNKLIFIGLIFTILTSCEKQPEACIEFDEFVDPDIEVEYLSCSKIYEFETWEFGDEKPGFLGKENLHTYDNEGKYEITLTSYAKGAYKSDELKYWINVSKRYIDSVVITGQSTYDTLVITRLTPKTFPNARGTFTDSAPLTYILSQSIGMRAQNTWFRLEGLNGPNEPDLIVDKITNLRFNVANPIILNGINGITMKVHWHYRTF